ncbi:Aldolase-type TIM barrel protein [Raphanus sativus]|nr:Aldolase-type TIM barrel protein [Raphanus sativus]
MFEGRNSELNSKLLPLIEWVFQEPNPIGVNTALAQLGVARLVFRLPYVPLPLSKRVEFVKLVKEIGREHFVGERDVQVLDDDDFVLIGRVRFHIGTNFSSISLETFPVQSGVSPSGVTPCGSLTSSSTRGMTHPSSFWCNLNQCVEEVSQWLRSERDHLSDH